VVAKQPVNSAGDGAPIIDEAIVRANEKLWAASEPVTKNDPVDLYLRRTRRLNLPEVPPVVRYHPSMGYYNGGVLVGHFPAMLAPVVDATGEMVAVHKTFLNCDGTKADLSPVKKLSRAIYPGATQGSAIQLFQPGPTLAVCEGVETALAVHLMADEYLPVWAAVSAHGLETLELPTVVRNLFICADHDDRGLQAAKRLAQRQTAKGVTCKILIPEPTGSDWADVAFLEV
jgi:putative DNA primase/helicase